MENYTQLDSRFVELSKTSETAEKEAVVNASALENMLSEALKTQHNTSSMLDTVTRRNAALQGELDSMRAELGKKSDQMALDQLYVDQMKNLRDELSQAHARIASLEADREVEAVGLPVMEDASELEGEFEAASSSRSGEGSHSPSPASSSSPLVSVHPTNEHNSRDDLSTSTPSRASTIEDGIPNGSSILEAFKHIRDLLRDANARAQSAVPSSP